MAVLGIDGIRGILADAGVEDGTIEDILAALVDSQDEVSQGRRIHKPSTGAFGGSATAAELGLHAGKAHHHVIDAISQIATGLEGYHRAVEHFRKDVHETDADQAREFTRRAQLTALIEVATGCTQSQDFSNDPACRLPGGASA